MHPMSGSLHCVKTGQSAAAAYHYSAAAATLLLLRCWWLAVHPKLQFHALSDIAQQEHELQLTSSACIGKVPSEKSSLVCMPEAVQSAAVPWQLDCVLPTMRQVQPHMFIPTPKEHTQHLDVKQCLCSFSQHYN
jgi:hypothetical protein